MVLVQFLFQGLIVFVTSIPLFWVFQNSLTWGYNHAAISVMNYVFLAIIPFSIFLEGLSGMPNTIQITNWSSSSTRRNKAWSVQIRSWSWVCGERAGTQTSSSIW